MALKVRQIEVAIRFILCPARDLDRVGGLEDGIRQNARGQGRTHKNSPTFLLVEEAALVLAEIAHLATQKDPVGQRCAQRTRKPERGLALPAPKASGFL